MLHKAGRPPVPVITAEYPPRRRREAIQGRVQYLSFCNLRLRRREAMLHKARRPPRPVETPGNPPERSPSLVSEGLLRAVYAV